MAQFRRDKGLPQIRRDIPRRNASLIPATKGNNRLPQLSSYQSRKRGLATRWMTIVFAVGLGLFALVLTAGWWLPLASLLIPDRYIMAYAPEPIQQMVFELDPSEEIPTPLAADQGAASQLFDTLAATSTPTPQTVMAADDPGSEAGYLQPTPVAIEPTPTLTPVFSYSVDPRAADSDNSADLSQASHLLTGFTWEQQGYNNCGPASIRVLMSYWDVEFEEDEAADFLEPNAEDPNVRPEELAAFVEQFGYQVTIRDGGNIDLLKQFILAGYPVMIETGYDPEPTTIGWTSHFLTLAGYSDVDQEFIAMDTYRRPNWAYPYEEIDHFWRQFNRRYLVAHRPDQAAARSGSSWVPRTRRLYHSGGKNASQ